MKNDSPLTLTLTHHPGNYPYASSYLMHPHPHPNPGNYPYASSYLMHGKSLLPPWPVRAA